MGACEMSGLPDGFEIDKPASDTFASRFAAAPGPAKGLPEGFDVEQPVTGPSGENPAYHATEAVTPTGKFIQGNVFEGRGLPGGTKVEKAAALGSAAAGGAIAPLIAAIAGPAAAPEGAAALLARQGVAPDIIDLLAGAEPKAASKIPGMLKSIGGAGGIIAAEQIGEKLGLSKDTVHDIGLPMLFKIFGGH
jgi:hypothetical protein